MSQFWHAHWAEDAFKPRSLLNWQVPNWHPKFPCPRGHCVTTKFLADSSGRLLADLPRSKRSPWGNFKGTWELPLKIDRKLAWKLSAPPKHKLDAWEAHKSRHKRFCEMTSRKTKYEAPQKQDVRASSRSPAKKEKPADKIKKTSTTTDRTARKSLKTSQPKDSKRKTFPKHYARIIEEQRGFKVDRNEPEIHGKIDEQEQKVGKVSKEELNVNEKKVSQESSTGKLDEKEESKIKKKSVHVLESESRLPVEVPPKAIRRKLCTVHQKLRV